MIDKKWLLLIQLFGFLHSQAQVHLPQLVSDGMVLQRDTQLPIWGWAAPGEKLTLQFNGKSYTVVTDAKGKWLVTLPAMKAGGPYEIDISASNKIHITNILVGDVWLGSGQSNMVITMERVKEKYLEEITSTDFFPIRNFFIPTLADPSKTHEDLPQSKWVVADAKTILSFGAATYFFAKQLYNTYHVPIGIINSSVGGAPIEAWISEEGLKSFPEETGTIARWKDTAVLNTNARKQELQNSINRIPRKETDKGLTEPVKWYDPQYQPKGWHTISIPGYWADQGIKGLNGVVWYRKEISVTEDMTGIPAKVFMGRIVDADQVYINGKLVGNITYQYPPRRYEIPAGILQEGKNIITVRVTNTAGKGGFVPDKPYYLTANGKIIDLKGAWQYKVGDVFAPLRINPNNVPVSLQNLPTALFNTLIAPITRYRIKGALWYQGEANSGRPEQYSKLLPALINDWRTKWQNPGLPFLYVQLPNFMEMQYQPSESQWAILRESQLKTLSVPNTAMAVAIDLGEWNDIHPLNKKDVGERLALAARKLVYGESNLVASGPLYQSATVEGNKIRILFNNTGSGLITKDGEPLAYFAVAGADKKFVWAKAVIENNTVLAWSDEITQPLYVRYAWADNPDGANLYNKEGLPASPFRTDH
ncbi:MAG: sialate O-acetylesterase [Bacteroidota bacterium]